MNTTSKHPFERAGLGIAPFRCVAVRQNWWVSGCGTVRKPGGTCSYCSTGILNEFVINDTHGAQFVVGCDCVRKLSAAVEGFREQRLQFARTQREEKRNLGRAQRQAEWDARRDARLVQFKAAEPELYATLSADGLTGFISEMAGAMKRWGSLTEGQLRAVKESLARDAQKKADAANSRFMGVVGKREVFKLEIIAEKTHHVSSYPPIVTHWHLMRDGAGNVHTYRGSKWLGRRGDSVRGKFTVKAHEEYKGVQQTVLARPALIEEAAVVS